MVTEMACATTTIHAPAIPVTPAVRSVAGTLTTMVYVITLTAVLMTRPTAVIGAATRIVMERVTRTTSAQRRLDRSRAGVARAAEMGRATMSRTEVHAPPIAGHRMMGIVIMEMEALRTAAILRAIAARVAVMA
jgi:hypothetical protein